MSAQTQHDFRDNDWWNQFWQEHTGYGAPTQVLIDFAKQYRDHEKMQTAIDIASGNGRYAIPLAKMGYQTDALEYVEAGVKRILENAKEMGVEVNAMLGDFTKLCIETRNYDLVLCSGLLEELTSNHHKNVLDGFMKWTRPGGLNIIKYCVRIKSRGQLVEPGFGLNKYTESGWSILYHSLDNKIINQDKNIQYDQSIEADIQTETIVAQKPE